MGELVDLNTVSLSKNSLTGTLPDASAAWRHIDVIHIQSNLLTGTLPDSWRVMPVRELRLSDNLLNGELPGLSLFGGCWAAVVSCTCFMC